ncbi:MAG: mechanosensitive ion channel family protein [Thermoplasmata archaeon]|nr:mechanosensitive ion channel family protein [Thermoplasmata archaeon]
MNFDIDIFGFTLYQILIAFVILLVGVLLAKILSVRTRRLFRDKVAKGPLEAITKLIYYAIILFTVFAALQVLRIDLSGLLIVGGLLAIAIGFASQSVISNLIAGIFLGIDKPMEIGDAVDIDGTSGVVEEVRIMSTRIRTFDGVYTRLPNEKVFNANIKDYSARIARRFEYKVGIRYQDDAAKATEIIKNTIDAHPLTLVNPGPHIFVDNLGDNSVNFTIRIWAPSSDWYGVKMKMLWNIKTALEENGIQIPFPQRDVWFKNKLEVESEKLKMEG